MAFILDENTHLRDSVLDLRLQDLENRRAVDLQVVAVVVSLLMDIGCTDRRTFSLWSWRVLLDSQVVPSAMFVTLNSKVALAVEAELVVVDQVAFRCFVFGR